MQTRIDHLGDVAVTHAPADTPCKRLGTLRSVVPLASTPEPFNKRLKIDKQQRRRSSILDRSVHHPTPCADGAVLALWLVTRTDMKD